MTTILQERECRETSIVKKTATKIEFMQTERGGKIMIFSNTWRIDVANARPVIVLFP